MIRIPRNKLLEHIQILESQSIPYTYMVNNHSFTVKSEVGKYFSTDNLIKKAELSFLKSVKHYVKKNKIYEDIANSFMDGYEKIKYFRYSNIEDAKVYANIYEVDIDQAYWETALKLGIINEELYLKGMTVEKKTRLAALGSLAKTTDVWYYDGHEMKVGEPIREDDTEYLWFMVCKKLGDTMNKAARAAGKDFIFYWVDGMYVTSKAAADRVAKSFEEQGFKSKEKTIHLLKTLPMEKQILVYDTEEDILPTENGKDGARKYPLAKRKKFWEFSKQ